FLAVAPKKQVGCDLPPLTTCIPGFCGYAMTRSPFYNKNQPVWGDEVARRRISLPCIELPVVGLRNGTFSGRHGHPCTQRPSSAMILSIGRRPASHKIPNCRRRT